MNNNKKFIILILYIISLLIFIIKSKSLIEDGCILFNIKYILIILITSSIIISLFTNNKINNEYIFPLLLFFNIGILLFFPIKYKNYNIFNILSIIGIIYLLLIFDYKKFNINKGSLINIDKSWIYKHIIILSLFYLSTSTNIQPCKNKLIILCLLLILPLLFPLKEYFIYRLPSLLLLLSLNLLKLM